LAGVAIATDFPLISFVLGSWSTFCLKVAEQPDTNPATKIRLATRIRLLVVKQYSMDSLFHFLSRTWKFVE
jgi:hypothetical protein